MGAPEPTELQGGALSAQASRAETGVGGEDRCAELLETIPNFDEIFERKTTEEVQSIMDQFLAGETGNQEVEKFGTNESGATDSVESAFSDLLNQ